MSGWAVRVLLWSVAEHQLLGAPDPSPQPRAWPPVLLAIPHCSLAFPCGSFFFWDVFHNLSSRNPLFNLLIYLDLHLQLKNPISGSTSDFTDLFVFPLTPLWRSAERLPFPHSFPVAWVAPRWVRCLFTHLFGSLDKRGDTLLSLGNMFKHEPEFYVSTYFLVSTHINLSNHSSFKRTLPYHAFQTNFLEFCLT